MTIGFDTFEPGDRPDDYSRWWEKEGEGYTSNIKSEADIKSIDGKQFSDGWAKVRERVRGRDNNTCQVCGFEKQDIPDNLPARTPENLDVHHIRPRKGFDDRAEADKLHNLVLLCRSCHRRLEGCPVEYQYQRLSETRE